MEITVTFRHLEPSDALKDYAMDKVSRIEKYLGNITEVHIILSHEKRAHIAEVIVHANRAKITAKEKHEDNMYASIDLVVDKIERQVKKHKDKITSHKEHKKALHNVFSADQLTASREQSIVKSESISIKTMSVDTALVHIGQNDDEFFVFKNIDTDNVNVLYKRRNGDFGLIEPENI
ncbi:MAG: ribosome-associated translation inhibitor RaiA [Deltaproteobacteria bacterium]|nr:ribosome-associated translation inhibitor RaiA [Deltaproteobacteria bacterium]